MATPEFLSVFGATVALANGVCVVCTYTQSVKTRALSQAKCGASHTRVTLVVRRETTGSFVTPYFQCGAFSVWDVCRQ